jgi:succinate-semialdehyde dehydrogenase / glutarate-semialdehyde dehydrogenase
MKFLDSIDNTNEKGAVMPYQIINPATEEVLRTFEELTDEELEACYACADRAHANEWRKASLSERVESVTFAAAPSRAIGTDNLN